MSASSQLALAVLLVAVLLFVFALMAWQEAKRRAAPQERVYVIEDAVRFIHRRLPEQLRSRLSRADVRRIVQWEVHYLQGLAEGGRRKPVETVAGGEPLAVEWIAAQVAARHGVTYQREDIAEVLAHEAAYLQSIGAVGEAVD